MFTLTPSVSSRFRIVSMASRAEAAAGSPGLQQIFTCLVDPEEGGFTDRSVGAPGPQLRGEPLGFHTGGEQSERVPEVTLHLLPHPFRRLGNE